MTLGPLEREVMESLWHRDDAATAREVHGDLVRHRPLAYTTVATSLHRLAKKGLVEQETGERAHRFRAAMRPEELFRDLVRDAYGLVPQDSTALVHFLGELAAPQRDMLRRSLDEAEELVRRRR